MREVPDCREEALSRLLLLDEIIEELILREMDSHMYPGHPRYQEMKKLAKEMRRDYINPNIKKMGKHHLLIQAGEWTKEAIACMEIKGERYTP